jgi:NADPH:quinone reductase-like Zn-dependent oxidoreductase
MCTDLLQIGVLMGARVVAVTRGADKASYLRRLGAAQVVDMGEGDPGVPLHKRLRAVAPKGGQGAGQQGRGGWVHLGNKAQHVTCSTG